MANITAQMKSWKWMKMYKVYEHVFPNGKRYIGITCQTLAKRFGSNGTGYKECPKMYKAIQKHGWENIEHNLLFDGLTKSEAEEKEIELIAKYNSTVDGYNIEYGGNVIGTHSEETKKKISIGNKGKKKPPLSEEAKRKISLATSGENNPFFGKHHSEEVKKEHSLFMIGNQYNKGNHHTDDFKKMKSKQMREKYKDGGNPRCRRVVVIRPNGAEEVFWSLRKASEVAGVSPSTMYKYLNSKKPVNGCIWRYADNV